MRSCRCAICIAVSLYPVWADVDAIYQVLKQAGEIRGNSTNSPPTPPTAEHPSSGAAPSSARASSHPCSSSTSGKTHRRIPVATLERSDRKPRNSSKRNPTGRTQPRSSDAPKSLRRGLRTEEFSPLSFLLNRRFFHYRNIVEIPLIKFYIVKCRKKIFNLGFLVAS